MAADYEHEGLGQVGVISDTHGLTRPQALSALEGSDLVIHAGDVGKPEVLEALKSIAPVIAVRGNIDKGQWARELPDTTVVKIGQILIYVLHNVKELDLDQQAVDFHVVIAGHSHRSSVIERNGVLFLNPGSAGPRRFKLPVSVARLRVEGTSVNAELVELKV